MPHFSRCLCGGTHLCPSPPAVSAALVRWLTYRQGVTGVSALLALSLAVFDLLSIYKNDIHVQLHLVALAATSAAIFSSTSTLANPSIFVNNDADSGLGPGAKRTPFHGK
ncbi:hypothetical protein B0T26DRAFT_676888 [Lasiosphaeria miniovina]|uniref:Uncharacterized protein n=1 Tax=Lasiosphaeria miniovina TaxID=1954250 RepID=A0AA40AAR2_9PEZI|nr:uncharacterized protein B0T26DRAFT_676888 [Lasiosphaeria miniovina]KAK0712426.1 hypothetical protein B0T26DRAFT_676888 [Lasiosphaeria miniovina]